MLDGFVCPPGRGSKDGMEVTMGYIYCLMGKSASGKDSIYKALLEQQPVSLRSIVTYTTRPVRNGETEGVEYHFTDLNTLKKFRKNNQIIEERCYHTVHGDWYYFTADDGQIKDDETYLLVMTPEGYKSLRDYFGRDRVRPIYVEVEDGQRLTRALEREKLESTPKYSELCRRFLADEADFAESILLSLGIEKRYQNVDFKQCLNTIASDLKSALEESRARSAVAPQTIIYPPKEKPAKKRFGR